MSGVTRYFALNENGVRRNLDAECVAEAHELLREGEIVLSERVAPRNEQIKWHTRSVVRFRNLHRGTRAMIRSQRAQRSRSWVCNRLADLAVYRTSLASHRAAIGRLMQLGAA